MHLIYVKSHQRWKFFNVEFFPNYGMWLSNMCRILLLLPLCNVLTCAWVVHSLENQLLKCYGMCCVLLGNRTNTILVAQKAILVLVQYGNSQFMMSWKFCIYTAMIYWVISWIHYRFKNMYFAILMAFCCYNLLKCGWDGFWSPLYHVCEIANKHCSEYIV